VVFGSFVFSIILWIIGLFILYIVIVISTAVKEGINKSVVGQFIEKKIGVKSDRKSFLDSDLDNEK
jgi:hypothetical protein